MVNVYRGEINETPFWALTVDSLHRLFGVPSSTAEDASSQRLSGTAVSYHALGLAFSLQRNGGQAGVQCWRVRIYLAEHWDAEAGKVFQPFTGRISKQVSHEWTPQRLETEFRQWYPRRYSRAQTAALVQEGAAAQEAQERYEGFYLDLSNFQVDFFYTLTPPRLHTMQLIRSETPPGLSR
ncbi:MAG: hypothetical protein AB7N91_28275 [Candidatus Tectimicrobiota bacterium]